MTVFAHTNDPLSSYKAAETVNLRGWHKRIYEVLERHDRPEGYTAKELAYIMSGEGLSPLGEGLSPLGEGLSPLVNDWRAMYFKVSKRLGEMLNKDLLVEGKMRPSLIGLLCNKKGEPIHERTVRVRCQV